MRPINLNHNEVMRVVRLLTARPYRMFHGDWHRQRGIRITLQVRLARVAIDGPSTTAGHDVVHPVDARAVRVSLDVVIKQMVVARQQESDMLLSE